MPLLDQYEQGTPCWVDLATSDLGAAKEFYSGLFDWNCIDEQMDDMGIGTYSMAMVNDIATATIYELGPNQLRPVAKPAWNVYVAVDDIEATLQIVQQNGGIVVVDTTDVGSAGHVAVIEDPTRCQTTLWQTDEFQGNLIRAEPGAIAWLEHVSTDLEQSVRFYEDALGVRTVTAAQGGLDRYTTWIVDDNSVAGMFQWPDEMISDGVPSMWFVYFRVTDLDAAVDYVEANGGEATAGEPAETALGRIIVLRDPQGADFCVVEPTS